MAKYNNGRWRGTISQFYPGIGYMYNSKRTESTPFAFTNAHSPEVGPLTVYGITSTNATVGSNILDDGGAAITQCGVCWSTEPNPTVNDNVAVADGVTDSGFTAELTGLTANTKYYIRAFATNSIGMKYGDEMGLMFIPEGAINGLFSVSENSQVYFSQGNLQFQPMTNVWRFAENQYDVIIVPEDMTYYDEIQDADYYYAENEYSSNYSGWIELFGWGTSGNNHGAVCYQPWGISDNDEYYYAYGDVTNNLYDETGEADWGCNSISNGGNTPNQWRTLTKDEWDYLVFTRTTNSGMRFVYAQVNGVNGVILLPDNWDPGTYYLNEGVYYIDNVISASQWSILENGGAVFLPAAGRRSWELVYNEGSFGNYWSSSYAEKNSGSDRACSLCFGGDNEGLYPLWISVFGNHGVVGYFRSSGFSVRLVFVITDNKP